jgi:hypothetical protein
MSLNMLQSVENFNVQANILGNYVRDVDICTQVYYSYIDAIWNFKEKFRYPNYVGHGYFTTSYKIGKHTADCFFGKLAKPISLPFFFWQV